jgi:hypothetical protein
VTYDDAAGWLEETGLCLFLPRHAQLPAPAPSFVEACMGVARALPPPEAIAEATALAQRLIDARKAVPLNLLGTYTEQPDFLVASEVLPWVVAIRGDRQWKTAPSGRTSPLILRTWEALDREGESTAVQLRELLGRELTEAAVLRALIELWTGLRAMPICTAGEPTRWTLLKHRHPTELATAANTGQSTALSALLSLYLRSAVAATAEEAEVFLSPLTSRSRIREVLHGMMAARQFATMSVASQTLLFVEGSLPEVAEPEAEPVTTAPAAASPALRRPPFRKEPHGERRNETGRRPETGTRPREQRAGGFTGGRTNTRTGARPRARTGGRTGGPTGGPTDARRGERLPSGSGPTKRFDKPFKKPFRKFGDRPFQRPAAGERPREEQARGARTGEGEAKPWQKGRTGEFRRPPSGDRPHRPWQNRPGGSASGERRPSFGARPGRSGGPGPQRASSERPGGERPRSDRPAAGARPAGQRPWSERPPRPGFRKPFVKDRRTGDDRPPEKEGEARRPFSPSPRFSGDRKARTPGRSPGRIAGRGPNPRFARRAPGGEFSSRPGRPSGDKPVRPPRSGQSSPGGRPAPRGDRPQRPGAPFKKSSPKTFRKTNSSPAKQKPRKNRSQEENPE